MNEIEIGRGKRGRRAYSFDDIAVVPSRRTRDPEEVSVGWQIDAYHFDLPVIAAPMDSVMSPQSAIAFGQHGGLPVLDLEGLWTRYPDPQPLLDEIAALAPERATARMQEIYREEIQPELIVERLRQVRDAGVTVAGALSPQRTQQFWRTVVDAGVDMFVIRGTTVSAEHVSGRAEPLNLKRFIYELDVPVIVGGVASYTPALHLMRTGAAGVLVGFGGEQRTRPGAPSAFTHRSPPRSPMSRRHDGTTSMSPVAAMSTSSPMAVSAPAATSSRPSRAVPTPSCSVLRSHDPPRHLVRVSTGARGAPRRPAAR